MKKYQGRKTEQLAQFLLEKGEWMSARDVVEAGFRFDGERCAPTTQKIQSFMTNFTRVNRYEFDKRRCADTRKNGYQIKVTAINKAHSAATESGVTKPKITRPHMKQNSLWQQVLRGW